MKREEAKRKLSDALSGRPKTEEHKAAISESLKGKTLGRRYPNRKKREPVTFRQVTCPHCGKDGSVIGMTRFHFDNCKLRS